MLSQKTFIKLMELKDWTPIDTGTRLFGFRGGIGYYLTFKDHETFECLCSQENRDKILNIKEVKNETKSKKRFS